MLILKLIYVYTESRTTLQSAALELLRAFHSHTFEITKYSFTQIITLITGGLVFVHSITKTTARKGFSEFYIFIYFITITIIFYLFIFDMRTYKGVLDCTPPSCQVLVTSILMQNAH